MHKFLKFIFGIKLYMFRTVSLSIISSFSLYTQHCIQFVVFFPTHIVLTLSPQPFTSHHFTTQINFSHKVSLLLPSLQCTSLHFISFHITTLLGDFHFTSGSPRKAHRSVVVPNIFCTQQWAVSFALRMRFTIKPYLFYIRCGGLTTLPLSSADFLEIWEIQPRGTLRTCPSLYRDCFTYLYPLYIKPCGPRAVTGC